MLCWGGGLSPVRSNPLLCEEGSLGQVSQHKPGEELAGTCWVPAPPALRHTPHLITPPCSWGKEPRGRPGAQTQAGAQGPSPRPQSEIPPSNLTSPGTAQHLGVGRLGQGASHDPSLRGGRPGGNGGGPRPGEPLLGGPRDPHSSPLFLLSLQLEGWALGKGLTPRDTGPPS